MAGPNRPAPRPRGSVATCIMEGPLEEASASISQQVARLAREMGIPPPATSALTPAPEFGKMGRPPIPGLVSPMPSARTSTPSGKRLGLKRPRQPSARSTTPAAPNLATTRRRLRRERARLRAVAAGKTPKSRPRGVQRAAAAAAPRRRSAEPEPEPDDTRKLNTGHLSAEPEPDS